MTNSESGPVELVTLGIWREGNDTWSVAGWDRVRRRWLSVSDVPTQSLAGERPVFNIFQVTLLPDGTLDGARIAGAVADRPSLLRQITDPGCEALVAEGRSIGLIRPSVFGDLDEDGDALRIAVSDPDHHFPSVVPLVDERFRRYWEWGRHRSDWPAIRSQWLRTLRKNDTWALVELRRPDVGRPAWRHFGGCWPRILGLHL